MKEGEADKKKTKKTKKVNKGRPDEDLFGNTDDVFAGVEPKKTTTKKKKKKTTTAETTEAAQAPSADGEGNELV